MFSFFHSKLHILHVASEIAPLAKVGGLADVVYGLSRATAALGHKTEVWIPHYAQLNSSAQTAQLGSVPLRFLPCSNAFERPSIYGYPDDVERFSLFARKVADAIVALPRLPDVVHLHDWPTALVAPLLKHLLPKPPKILFTIHNLEYQGRCLPHQISSTGLPIEGLQDPRDPKDLNLLLGGIHFSDVVTTVSRSYLEEILTPEQGHGLDQELRQAKGKLFGILNGIDIDFWNPLQDPHVPFPFNSERLDQKNRNKQALCEGLGLSSSGPLVAVITRLVPAKGPALIEEGLRFTLAQKEGSFILLGSSPLPNLQSHFENLQSTLSGSRAAFCLRYDEALSHRVYAAADLLLVPSLSEPCGLTQLIALRYGAVPVVRTTGGLKDTICDWSDVKEGKRRNGFSFQSASKEEVSGALSRAFHLYSAHPEAWRTLQLQGMTQDWSWENSAKKYIDLYK